MIAPVDAPKDTRASTTLKVCKDSPYPFQKSIDDHPCSSSLAAHPDFKIWQQACKKVHIQQHFLNTCIAAVFLQELIIHSPEFLSLHVLANNTHALLKNLVTKKQDHLLQMPAWPKGPTTEGLIKSRLEKAQKLLFKNESLFEDFILKKNILPLDSIYLLTKRWTHAMELLLSMAQLVDNHWGEDLDNLVTINTPKYFKNHWHTSAIAIALTQLFKTHAPRLKQDRYYRGYIDYDACCALLSNFVDISAPTEAHTRTLKSFRKNPLEPEYIWEQVRPQIGARIERPGHALYLQTIQLKQQEFLLHDPMAPKAIALNFTELKSFLKTANYEFFLNK